MQATATRSTMSNAAIPAVPPTRAFGVQALWSDGDRVWKLQRNCSLAPVQAGWAFAVVCAFSLAVALGFALAGAQVVALFTGIELLALAMAWLWWGRHASDGERVALTPHHVHVQSTCGSRVVQHSLPRTWLRVQRDAQGLWLQTHGQRIRVGAHASSARVRAFETELREALRAPTPLSSNQT